MRRHTGIRTRLIVALAATGLTIGAALAGPAHSEPGGTCGATADDFFGTFAGQRTRPANAPDASDDQPITVSFTAPDKMSSDNKAVRGGQTYATQKGTGTFSVGPLTWTERGTRTIGDKSGAYEMTFKAKQVSCTSGSRVTSFSGTFTSPQMAVSDSESYARQ